AGVEITRASGANSFTVKELFAKARELDKKEIRVRGQVVKFTPHIMGRNWIHLQDGTGNPMHNTHDLVLTSQATVKVGDTVTFTGVVAADRDFGAGYSYKVLIEQAEPK
ncbi:MAG: nucleotide-binding protein, partial [Deltaproteobacteria bacterium]